jgi:hypothetical protein
MTIRIARRRTYAWPRLAPLAQGVPWPPGLSLEVGRLQVADGKHRLEGGGRRPERADQERYPRDLTFSAGHSRGTEVGGAF